MKKIILIVLIILGVIIGIAITRASVLTGIEIVFFDHILDSISKGSHFSDRDLEFISKTDTFAKTSMGAIIGGFVGGIVGFLYNKKKP
jgi:hypothetical protein